MKYTNNTVDTANTGCWYKGTAEHECGKATVEGRNWCADHIWLIYREGTAQRRRKKDLRVADSVRMWENLLNEAVEELIDEGFDL